MWHSRNMCDFEKIFYIYIYISRVAVTSEIIKECLMFHWKILTPTFILTPFLLNLFWSQLEICLKCFWRPRLRVHLTICKMIISLGAFFHFLKILIFWPKMEQRNKNGPKLAKSFSAFYLRNNMWHDCGF